MTVKSGSCSSEVLPCLSLDYLFTAGCLYELLMLISVVVVCECSLLSSLPRASLGILKTRL